MSSNQLSAATSRPRSRLRAGSVRILRGMRRHALLASALLFVGGLMLAGLLAPLPHDPVRPGVGVIMQPPGDGYLFGTDGLGFDVFSRTIAAAGRDLPLAIIGTVLSMLIGVPAGLAVSGRSRWSERLMRVLDAFEAFPLIILAIVLVTLMGNQLGNVVVAIMAINIPRFMRLIRSEALAVRESRFIEAAIATGCSPARVFLRHVLPNVSPVITVQASISAAHSLLVIAGLSFLGVGVTPPEPSWGAMIQDGARQMVLGNWWVVVFPGLAVFLSVAALNLVADEAQAILDAERQ